MSIAGITGVARRVLLVTKMIVKFGVQRFLIKRFADKLHGLGHVIFISDALAGLVDQGGEFFLLPYRLSI
jgi:hypothetical protein